MGILDDLRNKVEKLGDKAKEGLGEAKDRAGDLLDDAKDRLGHHDDEAAPLAESSDVGPDTSSTDAVQPGYVAAEDDVTGTAADESSLTDDVADDADDVDEPLGGGVGSTDLVEEEVLVAEPVGSTDGAPRAAELDAEELAEDDAVDLAAETEAEDDAADLAAEAEDDEPAVETDVDPFDQPLTEPIGDEIAAALVDSEAVAEAVDDTDERDTRS